MVSLLRTVHEPSTPEGCVDDLAGAFRVNDPHLAVRLKRRLDAGVFLGRQGGRVALDRFDDVAAGWQVTEFGRKVRAVPRHDSCYSRHLNDSEAEALHRRKMRPMVDDLIVSDPQILGGKPCIRGTRLSVEFLLELAASGATQEQILAQYPQLTADGLAAAFRYAADVLKGEHTWELRITA